MEACICLHGTPFGVSKAENITSHNFAKILHNLKWNIHCEGKACKIKRRLIFFHFTVNWTSMFGQLSENGWVSVMRHCLEEMGHEKPHLNKLNKPYRETVESLLHMANATRPDIYI